MSVSRNVTVPVGSSDSTDWDTPESGTFVSV